MPLRPNEDMTLETAWELFFSEQNEQAKDFILVSYKPLVERIAREIMRKKPSNFEKQDLVQAGMIGLINSINRYRPDKGASFPTFAALRVRGAIFDEINAMDWTPRIIREKIKVMLRANEHHFKQSQDAPSPEDLSSIAQKELNKDITPDEIVAAQHQASRTYVHAIDYSTALEVEQSYGNDTGSVPNTVENEVGLNFVRNYVSTLAKKVCTEQEWEVVHAVYYLERSMRSIAEEWRVPVARISELRRRAVDKMRETLDRDGVSSADELLAD